WCSTKVFPATLSSRRNTRPWMRWGDQDDHGMRHQSRHCRGKPTNAPMKITRRYLAIVLTTAFVVGYIFPIGLFYAARPFGAAATIAQLAERQAKTPDLVFLPFDLRYNGAFKLDRIAEAHPDILCISSSRAGT